MGSAGIVAVVAGVASAAPLKSDFQSRDCMKTGKADHIVCTVEELPEGERRIVEVDGIEIGVFNCGGELLAIEDRCSHDDGPLAEGELDLGACTVECPRHGSLFDLRSGRPLTLPAFAPVETFPVRAEDGQIKLEVD
jgi:3-phenylpropionate/trans-cinnamate dioxygenase ferredoxin subunit